MRCAAVSATTALPEACRRSQLIGPYMLSMSTTTKSACCSGTRVQ
ncbi:hypothetical protein [Lysobacter gummosus]